MFYIIIAIIIVIDFVKSTFYLIEWSIFMFSVIMIMIIIIIELL